MICRSVAAMGWVGGFMLHHVQRLHVCPITQRCRLLSAPVVVGSCGQLNALQHGKHGEGWRHGSGGGRFVGRLLSGGRGSGIMGKGGGMASCRW